MDHASYSEYLNIINTNNTNSNTIVTTNSNSNTVAREEWILDPG